jgi:glutamine amidotransferase
MIVIVDYQMGNIGSVLNMVKRIGREAIISSERKEIEKATHIILPGVGSFDAGMNNLTGLGLIPILNELALVKKVPVLGICLGMQLMTQSSEEGTHSGLGWFDADTIKFDFSNTVGRYTLPNMGWKSVHVRSYSPLLLKLDVQPRFYFVHKYHVKSRNASQVSMTSFHGYEFAAAVENQNIVGVQFHPEKSHRYGQQLMNNFLTNY